MRAFVQLGCTAIAVLFLLDGAVLADDGKLEPKQPATGASLALYIKVKNQRTSEYCNAEKLDPAHCQVGKFWEAKDSCATPYKVASVSCKLENFDYNPRLIENSPDVTQSAGSCVWSLDSFSADKAPLATTTLICIK